MMLWIWLTLAMIALISELIFGILYFLILTLALLLTALLTWVLTLGFSAAVVTAAVLSLSGVIGTYYWRQKKRYRPQPYEQDFDIGAWVVINGKNADGSYYVRYRGTLWQARLTAPAGGNIVGKRARITGKEANTLLINEVQ